MMKHSSDGYGSALRRVPAQMLSNSGSLGSGSTKPRPNTTPISSIRVVQKGVLSSSTTRQSASLVKLSPSSESGDGGAGFLGQGSDHDDFDEIVDEVEDCVRLEDDLDTAPSSSGTTAQPPAHSSSISSSAAAAASPLQTRTPNVRKGHGSDKRHQHPLAGDADGYAGDAFEEEEIDAAMGGGGGSPLPVSPRPPSPSPLSAGGGAKAMPSKRSMSGSKQQPSATSGAPSRRGSRDHTPLRGGVATTKATAGSAAKQQSGGAPGSKKAKGVAPLHKGATRRPLTADVALEVAKTTAHSATQAAAIPLPTAAALARTSGFAALPAKPAPALATAGARAGPSPELPLKKLRVQVSHRALIGKGSFGVVYQAMDRDTNHIIACKEVCIVRGSGSSDQVSLIKKELALLKQLDHPNIVKCLGEDCDDKYLRIYMEFITGGSISSILRMFGPLQERQASVFTRQMLEGLKYLHAKNICHRDLKGDNLLVDTQGTLKLADFGAAKELATRATTIAGTAYFMAPEVIQGIGHGVEADVWSVGCCVVEMLTGLPPFHHLKNQYAIMMYIAEESRSLEEIFPKSVSPSCTAFLRRCLVRSPSKRATVAELLEDPWIVSPPEHSPDGEEAKLLDTGSIQLAGQLSIMEARQNSHAVEAEHSPPQVELGHVRSSPPPIAEPHGRGTGLVGVEGTPSGSTGLREERTDLEQTATAAPRSPPAEEPPEPTLSLSTNTTDALLPPAATHSFNPLDMNDDEP